MKNFFVLVAFLFFCSTGLAKSQVERLRCENSHGDQLTVDVWGDEFELPGQAGSRFVFETSKNLTTALNALIEKAEDSSIQMKKITLNLDNGVEATMTLGSRSAFDGTEIPVLKIIMNTGERFSCENSPLGNVSF